MPMKTQRNRRQCQEHYVSSRHLDLDDLKQEALNHNLENDYLYKDDIPNSPKPEFHVTRLKHDTDLRGLKGIRRNEGFRFPFEASDDRHRGVLLWWSLAVDHEEVKSAETRLLQQKLSNLTEDEASKYPSFLYKFTSSPAFSEKARLGSYRFTFNLEDVLEAYSEQFCSGDQPVMRIYETVLYKQLVQHTVLVHSPAKDKMFSEFPLLTDDPKAVCVYKDKHFIWRPYAMSGTHRYELVERPGENLMYAQKYTDEPYYIWNNVAIALHVDNKQVLEFDADQLRKNLKWCEEDQDFTKRFFSGAAAVGTFESFKEAEQHVKDLWPLDKERSLEQYFPVPDLRLVLVGRTGSGKSSSGNIILGRCPGKQQNILGSSAAAAAGSSSGNTQCCLQMKQMSNRMLTVVETPGLSETPEVKTEIRRSVDMLAPGPHAFLLLIKVGQQMDEEQNTVKMMEEIFGENVWSHTYVVLTYQQVSEDQVSAAEAKLKEILNQRVRDRFYNLYIDSWNDLNLLCEVEKMVVANIGKFYSVQDRGRKRKIGDVDGANID